MCKYLLDLLVDPVHLILSLSLETVFHWKPLPIAILAVANMNIDVCVMVVMVCLCWRCTPAGMTSDPDVILLCWAF